MVSFGPINQWEAERAVGSAAWNLAEALCCQGRPEATVLALLDRRRSRALLSPRETDLLKAFRKVVALVELEFDWIVEEQVSGVREWVRDRALVSVG